MTLTPPPTSRIRLRPYRTEDAPLVEKMFADDLARRFYPDMDQPEPARNWIRANLDRYELEGFGLWAIERVSTGEFLGDCGLTIQSVDESPLLEVGYHLLSAHRGHGYATEAGRACIEFAFRHTNTPLVCSIVDPENSQSIAVASRLHSFRRTANRRGRTMLLFWTDREAAEPEW